MLRFCSSYSCLFLFFGGKKGNPRNKMNRKKQKECVSAAVYVLSALSQFGQYLLRDRFQSVEHARAIGRYGFKYRFALSDKLGR